MLFGVKFCNQMSTFPGGMDDWVQDMKGHCLWHEGSVRRVLHQCSLFSSQAIDDDCNQTGQMLAALLEWPQVSLAPMARGGRDKCTSPPPQAGYLP